MQVALRAKGFDLGGVERMTDASWESFGLLTGQQARLKSGIAKWRLSVFEEFAPRLKLDLLAV